MRHLILIIIGFCLSFNAISQNVGDTIISNNPNNLKLKIFYFHITNRCNTCYSIEENVRKTLDTYFKQKIEDGIIDLYIMNCELPENKTLVKKYDAYGSTLAITNYINGKETKSEDMTNWAFQKIHNPNIFVNELKEKIEHLIQ
jgi:hypothetical protein